MTIIFNPNGNDTNIPAIGGNPTGLINLNNIRSPWAIALYKQMRENFWIPEKYDLSQDTLDWVKLTEDEQTAFLDIICYLTFLDSIQTNNLSLIKQRVTSPEIILCLAEQNSQEVMHNASYQYIIESVLPSEIRDKVYDRWRTNQALLDRCNTIVNYYNQYANEQTLSNFYQVLIANYLLEGIYFYSGFLFFYALSARHLMSGCADLFRAINRDELSHTRLFQEILREQIELLGDDTIITNGNSEWAITDLIFYMTTEAVKNEVSWSQTLIGDKILGLSTTATTEYLLYLANIRLGALGLKPPFNNAKNPYSHLTKLADTKDGGDVKTNFFESTVSSYVQSSSLRGWDF